MIKYFDILKENYFQNNLKQDSKALSPRPLLNAPKAKKKLLVNSQNVKLNSQNSHNLNHV
jgi:hypothetical protein